MFETLPDAIAFGTMITGGSGIAITAMLKFGGSKPSQNGYVRQTTCKAVHEGTNIQLADIKDQVGELFDQVRELNNFLRRER